jgi:hypothetical protein
MKLYFAALFVIQRLSSNFASIDSYRSGGAKDYANQFTSHTYDAGRGRTQLQLRPPGRHHGVGRKTISLTL